MIKKSKEVLLNVSIALNWFSTIGSFLFGIGGFIVTFIALISAVISYIILYNSTDFYKFFFTKKEDHESDSSIIDENETIW